MAAVLACLSGCATPASTAPPRTSARAAAPGKLGGYDPARNGSEDVNAALAAGRKDGRKVLILFGANDNADCRALALLSGDPAVAPLVADYHVVTVDVGDPGPHVDDNRDITYRMFLDLKTSGVPAVLVTKVTADNRAEDQFASDDGSFAHARSMTAAQLAAFLTKWR
jgi:protein disulfide-isomerase